MPPSLSDGSTTTVACCVEVLPTLVDPPIYHNYPRAILRIDSGRDSYDRANGRLTNYLYQHLKRQVILRDM